MGGMKKKGYAAGGLKTPSANQTGLKKLPKAVRNKMGYMNKGGMSGKKKDMKGMGMYGGGMSKKKKGYSMGGVASKGKAKGGKRNFKHLLT